jgi:hypothetical protein
VLSPFVVRILLVPEDPATGEPGRESFPPTRLFGLKNAAFKNEPFPTAAFKNAAFKNEPFPTAAFSWFYLLRPLLLRMSNCPSPTAVRMSNCPSPTAVRMSNCPSPTLTAQPESGQLMHSTY